MVIVGVVVAVQEEEGRNHGKKEKGGRERTLIVKLWRQTAAYCNMTGNVWESDAHN